MIIIKKAKYTLLALAAFVCAYAPVNAQENINIYVNGMRMDADVIMDEDKTYVPIRAVSEALGAEVVWDESTNSAFITFTEENMVAKVVENSSPCVVTIVGNYSGSDIPAYYSPTVHGSGVIYKSNGYIITNAHVVDDITNLTVVLSNGTVLPGKVLYSDEKSDLAIVKINKVGLTPIKMADSHTVVSGKTAIAVGTPISLSMRNTVTQGIVCGTDVSIPGSFYKLLQTDATVNPGNSGGPLLNSKGELIGINSAKYVNQDIENVAFAIPVDTVKYAISQFEKYGYIKRPSLALTLEQSWEAKIGLPTSKGITVKSSDVASVAAGDVITAVNSVPVHSISDWNEAIKDTYNGSSLIISYVRNGVVGEIELNI